MNLVHETIVNTMSADDLDYLRDNGEVRRPVTIAVLRRAMAERFGSSQTRDGVPEIPQHKWLIDAMTAFVAMGWAQRQKSDDTNGEATADYTYIVKRRKQPMEQFLTHCADAMLAERAKRAAQKLAQEKAPPLSPEWVAPADEAPTELLEDLPEAIITVPARPNAQNVGDPR